MDKLYFENKEVCKKMQLEDCKECNEMYENNEEKECIGCSCSGCLFN